MFNLINKHPQAKPEEAEWFASETKVVLFEKINAQKEFIKLIKVFYNSKVQSCIVRVKLDEGYFLENENLYFLLDYRSREMTHSGRNFDHGISDKDSSITWINNNEVWVFYPDNNTMSVLTKKL